MDQGGHHRHTLTDEPSQALSQATDVRRAVRKDVLGERPNDLSPAQPGDKLHEPASIAQRWTVSKAHQGRAKPGKLPRRTPVKPGVGRKHGGWLAQPWPPCQQVSVEEDITENQRPIGFAPVRDMPGRVPWDLDHDEAPDVVPFPQRPIDGMTGPCREPSHQTADPTAGFHLPALHGGDVCSTAP